MLTPMQYRRLTRLMTRLMTPLEIDLLSHIRSDPDRMKKHAYVHNLLMFRWWGMTLEPEEQAAIDEYVANGNPLSAADA